MRGINLISLLNAYHNLNKYDFSAFKKYYGLKSKEHEICCIEELLAKLALYDVPMYENFYLSYQIPHIGKEFDLLRFGDNHLINIELKTNAPKKAIWQQLKNNKYYLNYLNSKKYYFCYVAKANRLYQLNENNQLINAKDDYLIQLLQTQKLTSITNVDDLFDPANYLVSPFNSPKKFLQNQYFLTSHQNDIQKRIFDTIEQNKKLKIFTISGEYGTGKSLLTYHIAKRLINAGFPVLILHCGNLNDGHWKLQQQGFNIVPLSQLTPQHFKSYGIVIIDEAQRIHKQPHHHEMSLQDILYQLNKKHSWALFSYDKKQTLSHSECGEQIEQVLYKLPNFESYHLTNTIRTNQDIVDFIQCLFNKNTTLNIPNNAPVEFIYCSEKDAIQYLNYLNQDYKIIQYSLHKAKLLRKEFSQLKLQSSYDVLGQEFDNVAIFIDKYFTYNAQGKLTYPITTADNDEVRCLYQNITRTRKKLKIVIIENKEILKRCLELLND